jgi:hypothetical protein
MSLRYHHRLLIVLIAPLCVFEAVFTGPLAAPASRAENALPPHHSKVQIQPEPPPQALIELAPGTLSSQEQVVGQIAVQNGDLDFLMIDKRLGKAILFKNGKPVYSGAALTGESTADRLPPNSLSMRSNKMVGLNYKVTPAGRFTLERDYDRAYGGPLFNIKELIGKDWEDSIHRVYLGTPSEHRAERLASPNEAEKHISYGCINVSADTIRILLRELPKKPAPVLYILPQDEVSTEEFFQRPRPQAAQKPIQ